MCGGNHCVGPECDLTIGSIPACARGTWSAFGNEPARDGLSPRVRGNLSEHHVHVTGRRSIPACAGEPNRERRSSNPIGVYPRVCGGTSHVSSFLRSCLQSGLSPRVRGNQPLTPWPRSCLTTSMVYPRVCGGTQLLPWPALINVGEGSIPACAGEPPSSRKW